MRSMVAWSVAALLAASAGHALAGQAGAGSAGSGSATQGQGSGSAQQRGQDPATAMIVTGSASGTIRQIDHRTGKVTIDSDGETLTLKLPTTGLSNFKQGDKVTVATELAIAERTGAASGAGSGTRSGTGAGAGSDYGTGTGSGSGMGSGSGTGSGGSGGAAGR